MIKDTNGLYIQIKRKLINGYINNMPIWTDKITERAKQTCLLIGSWIEIDGDISIIEKLYGNTYECFLKEVLPYSKGEDPLLCINNINGIKHFNLSSSENTWKILDVCIEDSIWEVFYSNILNIIYDKGEILYSKRLKEGMLNTLRFKSIYKKEYKIQNEINYIIKEILHEIKNKEDWIYISNYWLIICEIAPDKVLERLDKEKNEPTGLLKVFEDKLLNSGSTILRGLEQFLLEKEFFWETFRLYIYLDLKLKETRLLKDVFKKIFCIWGNFTYLQTSENKIKAAKIAFKNNPNKAWEYLYTALITKTISTCDTTFELRQNDLNEKVEINDFLETLTGYLELLLNNTESNYKLWKKLLSVKEIMFLEEIRKKILEVNCIMKLNT